MPSYIHFMKYRHNLFFILFIICEGNALYQSEKDLMRSIMGNYDKHWRPISNYSKPLDITLFSIVRRIEKLDEQNEVLTTTLQLTFGWVDDHLNWNITDTNNIVFLEISPELVWLPKFDIFNNIQNNHPVPLDLKNAQKLLLDYTGGLSASLVLQVDTSCEINLLKFPFDKQTCKIYFGTNSVSYYIKLVTEPLTFDPAELDDPENYFGTKSEWLNVTSSLKIFTATKIGFEFTYATIYISMERNPVYYVIYLLIPSVLMAFVSVLVFLLPPESGERIGLSITVLLSYTVFSLMVSEVTPRGGSSTSVLVCYITTMMCLSAVILLLNILILRRNQNKVTPENEDGRKKCLQWNIDLIIFTILSFLITLSTIIMLGIIMT